MRFLVGFGYNKRDVPVNPTAHKAWLETETGNIRRQIAGASHRAVTAAYTAMISDGLILADATGGAFTVTLPAPATVPDMSVIIKRTNGGGNAVTIGGTVDGTVNRTLASQYSTIWVWSANGSWWRVGAI